MLGEKNKQNSWAIPLCEGGWPAKLSSTRHRGDTEIWSKVQKVFFEYALFKFSIWAACASVCHDIRILSGLPHALCILWMILRRHLSSMGLFAAFSISLHFSWQVFSGGVFWIYVAHKYIIHSSLSRLVASESKQSGWWHSHSCHCLGSRWFLRLQSLGHAHNYVQLSHEDGRAWMTPAERTEFAARVQLESIEVAPLTSPVVTRRALVRGAFTSLVVRRGGGDTHTHLLQVYPPRDLSFTHHIWIAWQLRIDR